MTLKTAGDFDQALLDLFDRYVHGLIDRRGFLNEAARFAVGGVTASMLLDTLNPRFAAAQQIPPDDKRLHTERISFPSPQGNEKTSGYLARRATGRKKLPAILVVHENRGLNPHIEDVTRRLALDGFLAFAPDALAPLGGYPGDEDRARTLFGELDQTRTQEDFVAAVAFLRAHTQGSGKVGVVGFCYGGGVANMLATRLPDLNAAVPFYGRPPALDAVAAIKAPLLLHYAEKDTRINEGLPDYEKALKAAKVKYQLFVYPNAQHGFNNDTTPRYDKAAATVAWKRTVSFFKKNLRG